MAANTLSAERRKEMLQQAFRLFMQQGFTATSMEQLAQVMGIAKQTLYNHFSSKEKLFEQVVLDKVAGVLIPLQERHSSLRETLLQFGHAFRAMLLSAEGLAMYRIMLGEAGRFPELAKIIYDSGPGNILPRLTQVLAQAVGHSHLPPTDPVFAADMLLSMLAGLERTLLLLGAPPLDSVAEHQRVAAIIDRFLLAFGIPPGPVHTSEVLS